MCENLTLGLRAYIGFFVKSGLCDSFIESLAVLAQVEEACLENDNAKRAMSSLMENLRAHLKKYLHHIYDQFKKRNNVRYLDTANASGVFSIAKFFSLGQQSDYNTSITTDGDYLYMYVGVSMKAMMYKIGTGATENTIAGKVYIERRGDKEGDISWTYCEGTLFSRRTQDASSGIISMYSAKTLAPLGDAKLQCGKIFSEAGTCCEQANRFYPIFADPIEKHICIVTMQVVEKTKTVKKDMLQKHATMKEERQKRAKENAGKPALSSEDQYKRDRDMLQKKLEKTLAMAQSAKKGDADQSRQLEATAATLQRQLIELEARRHADRDGSRGRGRRGGSRGPPPSEGRSRRSKRAPEEPPAEKKDEEVKKAEEEDPDKYRVCQFFLHKFSIDETSEPVPS